MFEALKLLSNYSVVASIVALVTLLITILVMAKVYIVINRHMLEAFGNQKKSGFTKLIEKYLKHVKEVFERGDKEIWVYTHAKLMVKQAGFYGMYSFAVYILMQFILPIVVFFVLLILLFPEIYSAILLSGAFAFSVFIIVKAKKMEVEKDFKRSAYKVYRYMYNQLAAGVSIHDTIMSLYLTGRDTMLSRPLTELSARYARTLDIKESLDEFKKYFTLPEIHTLCTALEQGVKTGESEKLLHRQEKSMFKTYFNYIQTETEKSKTMTLIIAGLLAGIIVLMIMIPMIGDIGGALGEIFGSQ